MGVLVLLRLIHAACRLGTRLLLLASRVAFRANAFRDEDRIVLQIHLRGAAPGGSARVGIFMKESPAIALNRLVIFVKMRAA
jgi:hypothetical protein